MQCGPRMNANEIVRTVEIDAPARVVWRALVDLGRFSEWNPFIRAAEGELYVGGTVRVRVRPSLPLPLRFGATVIARDEERELRWRGHVLAAWLGSGEHTFTVTPIGPSRARLTQREVFTGVLPRLFGHLLVRETERGFDAMNRALAARVEGARPASTRAAHALA